MDEWTPAVVDLSAYVDTDLALERDLSAACWATTSIAGLQYYDYGRPDDLLGVVMPRPGDRLQVVREPDNRADRLACRVEWRNSRMLGHLPRGVAADVGPRLDAGETLRAYVYAPGDGHSWSLVALLVGPAVADLHGQRLARVEAEQRPRAKAEVREASEAVWGPRRPSARAEASARAWAARVALWQHERRAAAVYALSLLPPERLDVDLAADPGQRGAMYPWWDDVAPGLRTRTQWREAGRRLRTGAAVWARISYGHGRRGRCHDLYAVADTEPTREISPQARAAAVERGWRATHAPDDGVPIL